MKLDIFDIIPKKFRLKGVGVGLTIFVRALLNFVGLAALLPVLYLILDTQSIHSNSILHNIYTTLGFDSDQSFVIAVAVSVVIFIIIKNLINLLLYRVERDYIYELYGHLSRRLFIGYFNQGLQAMKGKNTAVLSRNVNVVCYTFITGVLRPIATLASEALLLAMIFLSIAIYSSIGALLAVAVFIPVAWIYFALMRRRLDRYGNVENEAQRRKYRDVIETFRGYADIEINNAFDHRLSLFNKELDTIVSVGRKNATISMLPQNLTETGLAIGMALLLCLGTILASTDMKLLFGIFAVAGLRLLPSARNIMGAWSALRYNRYTIDVLNEAKVDSTKRATNSEQLPLNNTIEVRDLSFRFENSTNDTLHNLSLTIRKGEKLGINGESGVGKTTLLNILLGLYEPSEGGVYIDGKKLEGERLRKWQNSIGYVSQNTFLIDSSILANIALGCEEQDVDMQHIEKCIEAASLSEFIASLPKGIHTRIGECGAMLSGGQRQRIGIARALYKQANILFFDEATSSLDNATEQSINRAIENLSTSNENLTIVVVAHRDSSLGYCDRIVTLEKNEQ
ncbi:MAG: ATP-binding cassette domain-containing protein [Alistipes sp.]|nr:ATP-binding cassette domain-containing protein [Alistipes sp.]